MFMNTMENRVTMDLDYVGGAKMGDWNCNEWKVALHYNGNTMHTPFYTGVAIAEPRVEDVLHSLFSDSSAKDFDSFEDWAGAYGYDTNSRKAEQTYYECLNTANMLLCLLGHDYDYFAEKLENY